MKKIMTMKNGTVQKAEKATRKPPATDKSVASTRIELERLQEENCGLCAKFIQDALEKFNCEMIVSQTFEGIGTQVKVLSEIKIIAQR